MLPATIAQDIRQQVLHYLEAKALTVKIRNTNHCGGLPRGWGCGIGNSLSAPGACNVIHAALM